LTTAFSGSDDDNRLEGGKGNDDLLGRGGNDVLSGDDGDDALDGGDGNDAASFLSGSYGKRVVIDLVLDTASGQGDDLLSSVENVRGSPGNDTLIGDEEANALTGGDGNDAIHGAGGDDLIYSGHQDMGDDVYDSGDGIDTIRYESTVGVIANLAKGRVKEGSEIDSLSSIENLIGSQDRDVIRGDDQANVLRGGPEKDRIFGNGGNDTLMGGKGPDSLDGGPGDDSLNGGPQANTNEGGEGFDHCIKPDSSGGASGCELP
jgi:Ca2+-binding RTX toxin-like protein